MNILEASRATGVSRDMIRFYEKKGILSPARNPGNHYREYGMHEIHQIILARQYNSMGVDLDTIAKMFRKQDLLQAETELSQGIAQLQEEAEWAAERLENAKRLQALFPLLKQENMQEISERPASCYLPGTGNSSSAGLPVVRIHLGEPFFQDLGIICWRSPRKNEKAGIALAPGIYLRKLVRHSASELFSRKEAEELKEGCRKDGWDIGPDFFISQVLCGQGDAHPDLLCIEAAAQPSR